MPAIGVLSYQGGFAKHLERLGAIGCEPIAVRDVATLARVDALIIPGGESTTIGMLLERFGLLEALKERIPEGFPVFGTCAGAILLAREIENSAQPRIGAMDIAIRRNAYGRQIESFEADASAIPDSGFSLSGFHGVFIRAPKIIRVGADVVSLLEFEGQPILVRSGRLLAATFHPELTGDDRIHRYFVETLVSH
ncbi:MAG TPA: pyridoxal 5'-phosphate synthase glutaminase subunit PdxT [Spirochaetia bacterium]|nr:pyridoxal 5'-phosphate synthase glutaminase subunit PdxT [Spirochaetia bacterium]